jgi:hypothetical protein
MSSLIDLVNQQFSGNNLGQISQQIGADEGTTQHAINLALPVLLGGLARNASQPQGAAALDRALDNHDGGLLDNLGSMLGGGGALAAGGGILGHILGGKRAPVEQGIGQATGLSGQQVGKLLLVLAPIVMAALSRMRQQQGVSTDQLGPVLQQQQQEVAKRAPGLGGLAGILDQNNDGNIVDDLARMGPGLLGGLLGGR